MALSKRNSRIISVDGTDYRWAPSQDSGYYTLVVQSHDGRGRRLEVIVSRDDHVLVEKGYSVEYGDTEDVILTPSLVADLIRKGLRLGWRPNDLGPPVELSAIEGELTIRRGL